MANFQTRLEQLIKESDLTVDEISNKLEINKSSLYRYLKNERTPSAKVIEDLALFFNVSVDFLLGKVNDPVRKAMSEIELPDGIKIIQRLDKSDMSEEQKKAFIDSMNKMLDMFEKGK